MPGRSHIASLCELTYVKILISSIVIKIAMIRVLQWFSHHESSHKV